MPESEAHLKYLGNLYDSCQEVLLQYVEFLFNHLEIPTTLRSFRRFKIYACALASNLPWPSTIARPKLVHSMKQIEAAEAAEKLRAELTRVALRRKQPRTRRQRLTLTEPARPTVARKPKPQTWTAMSTWRTQKGQRTRSRIRRQI